MNWIRNKSQSLFLKIFLSFLAIIVLFGMFYMVIFQLFKTSLQKEIIETNQRSVRDTMERFSNQFSRLQVLMFDIYNHSDLIGFNNQLRHQFGTEVNYLKARDVMLQMRSDIYNPLFFLEDTLIYLPEHDFVLSKSGSGEASYMLGRSYSSAQYPYSFWRNDNNQRESFTLLPSATYRINHDLSQKRLMPFVFKQPESPYEIIALIDIDKAAQSFFGESGDRSLAILNTSGEVLYATGQDSFRQLPAFNGQKSMLHDGTYYFMDTDMNGFTYISSVPYSHVSAQLSRITGALLLIFCLSVAVALAASYFFSRRLHRPVKQILTTVLNRKPAVQASDSAHISEYDLIHNRIQELVREKEEIRERMDKHQSVLTSYSYISQLKSINTDISEWEDFLSDDGSFIVVLYHIRFRMNPVYELPLQSDQAVRHMLEHIHLHTAERYPGSHTFQIEKNEIVSIFKREEATNLEVLLQEIKAMLNEEKNLFLVTIAVSSQVSDSSSFNKAYHQIKGLTAQAPLLEESQIVTAQRILPTTVNLSPSQEKGLLDALQSGSNSRSLQIIEQALDALQKKEAGIAQFRFFADSVASKILSYVEMAQIDKTSVQSLKHWSARLAECHSLAEYEGVFRQLIEASCA
ncbi:hypothetical protein [Paenibacillus sp. JCM 10914]|uniref:hypothetical protein n=1 Tax=Paenibacillus sp. JCM 10914 TaxID=1236974 RepID=UPI0003CC977F|nr:hypothetical protein [Paenibacillus sp. JCM 10914]GAE09232.1 two-component response regulator yesN, associated with MetSO reductase [Paenibacillus sp. JCM 10914]